MSAVLEPMTLVVSLNYYVYYFLPMIDEIKFILLDLDIASGSTVDWAYDDLKIPFAYTIELPPKSCKLFLLLFFL